MLENSYELYLKLNKSEELYNEIVMLLYWTNNDLEIQDFILSNSRIFIEAFLIETYIKKILELKVINIENIKEVTTILYKTLTFVKLKGYFY